MVFSGYVKITKNKYLLERKQLGRNAHNLPQIGLDYGRQV
jgi:hypothetical protein